MIQPAKVFHDIYPNGQERPLKLQWEVRRDLPYFEGHFPGTPILPGIAILDASTYILQRALGDADLRVQAVNQAKFMHPIQPGLKVRIELQDLGEREWQVDWKEEPSGEKLSSLRLLI